MYDKSMPSLEEETSLQNMLLKEVESRLLEGLEIVIKCQNSRWSLENMAFQYLL